MPKKTTPADEVAETLAHEDELDARAPTIGRVWLLTKANLGALLCVVVSFIGVGWVVNHNDHEQRSRDKKEQAENDAKQDQQRIQRRAEFCAGIHHVLEGPLVDTFAVAFEEPLDSPVVRQARQNLKDGLGPDCTGPQAKDVPETTTTEK